MNDKFTIIRDEYGFACAIAEGEQWVILLNVGATRNEEQIERIVSILNSSPPEKTEEG